MRLLPPLLSHSQLCNNFLHPKNQERLTMARREEEEQVRALFIVAFAHSHSHATSKHTQLLIQRQDQQHLL